MESHISFSVDVKILSLVQPMTYLMWRCHFVSKTRWLIANHAGRINKETFPTTRPVVEDMDRVARAGSWSLSAYIGIPRGRPPEINCHGEATVRLVRKWSLHENKVWYIGVRVRESGGERVSAPPHTRSHCAGGAATEFMQMAALSLTPCGIPAIYQ